MLFIKMNEIIDEVNSEVLEVLIPMQKEAEEKAGLGRCECDEEVQE